MPSERIPWVLHTRQPDSTGIDPVAGAYGRKNYLGSQAWSEQAEAHFGPMVPATIARRRAEALDHWRRWWDHPDIIIALRQRFVGVLLDAVIALEERHVSLHDLAAQLRCSVPALDSARRRIKRAVRGPDGLLPYEARPDRAWRETPEPTEPVETTEGPEAIPGPGAAEFYRHHRT